MKRSFVWTLVLVASFTLTSAANWTPEQQQALDHLQGCWNAWEKSVAERDRDVWVQTCRPDPEILMWFDGDGMPQDQDAQERLSVWSTETIDRVLYTDIRPIDIKIHGDTALIAFYAYGAWIDKNGKRIVLQDKRIIILQKKSGQWTFIGGMATQVPSVPYWQE
jgi:hypothetical protein